MILTNKKRKSFLAELEYLLTAKDGGYIVKKKEKKLLKNEKINQIRF